MDVVVLKLKIDGKVNSVYHFTNVRKAAEFQQVFIDKGCGVFQVLHRDVPETSELIHELSLDANNYGEAEYYRIFEKGNASR